MSSYTLNSAMMQEVTVLVDKFLLKIIKGSLSYGCVFFLQQHLYPTRDHPTGYPAIEDYPIRDCSTRNILHDNILIGETSQRPHPN